MKIFIINLERSRERKTHMQEKLALLEKNPLFQELGLSYQFFNAVDSKSEGFKEYATMFNPLYCYLWHGRILIDNEIACYASHYNLWEECVRLNEPIIVLEDDIFFEEHFLSALQDIKRTTFSLVRFYTITRSRDKYIYKLDQSNYHYSLKNTNGAQGYYITPLAAKVFLAQQMWDSPVDIYMEHVALHHIDNIIYKPFIVGEDNIAANSTITNTDRGYTPNDRMWGMIPLRYKILKPFYRTYMQIRRALFKLSYKPPHLTYIDQVHNDTKQQNS
ncbi:glycosyltransferase family 25 protein [Helicobacter trogontum]|uniref:glycosyltransferase family 25 protein n=1 Tax=Helicobacter trogontum TaxID=50960 RepID=UPI00131A43DA|nr:glycosyltransferase family 25 protein [Helicobacter trogontum]